MTELPKDRGCILCWCRLPPRLRFRDNCGACDAVLIGEVSIAGFIQFSKKFKTKKHIMLRSVKLGALAVLCNKKG